MSVIRVEDVTMCYKHSSDKITSFKSFLINSLKHQIKHNEHTVFSNLNFEVEKGDVVGIIGRNGAGKSTLLKIIAGVLSPTKGKASVEGNIVPMLELGSGFDFDLTGRENVFLNGAILGYSESFLKGKYDEIVEFSELGDFIEQPIRNYSSGMIARLAFAIATVVEPEILIVDEILAVGDEAFQKKSKRKMLSLMGGGCTVLFVSHSVSQIREMCTKVLWLEDGKMRMFGDTKKVCDAYQEFLNPKKMFDDTPDAVTAQAVIKKVRDVLYIYNERDINYYYRVGVGKEQLLAANIQAGELNYKYLTEEYINKNNVFIFVECPETDDLIRLIRYIKKCEKTVIFDVTSDEDISLRLIRKVYDSIDGIMVSNERLKRLFEDKDVFVNTYCVTDRIMQLSDWAVYDRDVLPFISDEEITSEDMQINCNRAKNALKEKNEYKRNICYLNDEYRDEDRKKIIEHLCKMLTSDNSCRLIIPDCYKEEAKLKELEDRIKFIPQLGYEDVPETIAMADELICFSQNGIISHYDEIIKCIAGLTKVAVRTIDIGTQEENINNPEVACLEEIKKHAIYRRTGMSRFISKYRKAVCGILVDTSKRNISDSVVSLINKYKKLDYNVYLFDYSEQADHDNKYPCNYIGISDSYIGMAFDCLIATDFIGYGFVKSYSSAQKKYYLVEEFEADKYEHGDFNQFLASQSYSGIGDVTYLALTNSMKTELIDKFGINQDLIEVVSC